VRVVKPGFGAFSGQAVFEISFSLFFLFEDRPMSNIPADLRYAATHEWTREGSPDGTITRRITDHAQRICWVTWCL